MILCDLRLVIQCRPESSHHQALKIRMISIAPAVNPSRKDRRLVDWARTT